MNRMDDVVSRQAAINTVHEMRKKCDTDSIDDYEKMLAVALGELCTAQRTGRWIEQDDSWDGVYYECSACGEPWTLIDGTPWDNGMKFCPNCGADMKEGNSE